MDINFVIFVFRKLFTTILTSGATKRHTTLPGEGLGLIHKRPSCQLIGRQPSPCKICLGMKIGYQLRFFTINKSASSLYSLIVYGQYRATSLGRNKRKTLIGSQASLQNKCNKEGFNAICSYKPNSKARIGITSNEVNDCVWCDSRFGFGTGETPDNSNTCGNEASYSPDNGDKHIKTMGYIFVQ